MHKLHSMLLFIGIVGAFFAIPQSEVIQAAGCSGMGCNGKDPIAMGCANDAYTVTSAEITSNGSTIGRVDLRWSPSCQTNWSRVVSYVGGTNMFVMLTDCAGNELSGTYYQAYGTSVYGDMRYNTTVRALGAFGWNRASDMFKTTGCY
ncbi:MAG: DUF2690 domain-containing protein [Blastochloris sp.]|nr:DUF2690 domain-containing protein [Blastochloris sp.]